MVAVDYVDLLLAGMMLGLAIFVVVFLMEMLRE